MAVDGHQRCAPGLLCRSATCSDKSSKRSWTWQLPLNDHHKPSTTSSPLKTKGEPHVDTSSRKDSLPLPHHHRPQRRFPKGPGPPADAHLRPNTHRLQLPLQLRAVALHGLQPLGHAPQLLHQALQQLLARLAPPLRAFQLALQGGELREPSAHVLEGLSIHLR